MLLVVGLSGLCIKIMMSECGWWRRWFYHLIGYCISTVQINPLDSSPAFSVNPERWVLVARRSERLGRKALLARRVVGLTVFTCNITRVRQVPAADACTQDAGLLDRRKHQRQIVRGVLRARKRTRKVCIRLMIDDGDVAISFNFTFNKRRIATQMLSALPVTVKLSRNRLWHDTLFKPNSQCF